MSSNAHFEVALFDDLFGVVTIAIFEALPFLFLMEDTFSMNISEK